MQLRDYIKADLTWVVKEKRTRDQLLRDLTRQITASQAGADADALYQALLQRESQRSTATPEGVALPHAMVPGLSENVVAVALAAGGVDFMGKGCPPCDLVFVLAGPPGFEHVRLLARIARICYAPGALERLRAADSDEELFRRLVQEDQSHG